MLLYKILNEFMKEIRSLNTYTTNNRQYIIRTRKEGMCINVEEKTWIKSMKRKIDDPLYEYPSKPIQKH